MTRIGSVHPSISTMMALRRDSDADRLVFDVVPLPEPGIDEVLVQVHAAGVTTSDVLGAAQVVDRAGDTARRVVAAEFAGKVAAFGGGDGEGRFVVGEEVFGLVDASRGDAAAEYVVVRATSLSSRPRTVSYAESAALPLAAVGAWNALAQLDGLRPGRTLIVPDATSVRGLCAVQLARTLGAKVIAEAPLAAGPLLRGLGAHLVVTSATSHASDLVLAAELSDVPSNPEPQLAVVAGLTEAGQLRPVVRRTVPLGAATEVLVQNSSTGPGRTVLVVR
jgi:NADPH:quinone reductase-like Zn-dependent oxidoreductase